METEQSTTAKPPKGTAYTILRELKQDEDFRVYAVHSEVRASGAKAARQEAFEKLTHDEQVAGATLVAVPTRSWDPKRRELPSHAKSVEV